jgi:hypothetical protein
MISSNNNKQRKSAPGRWRRLLGDSAGDLLALMVVAGFAAVAAAVTGLGHLWGNLSGDRVVDVRAGIGEGVTVVAPPGLEVVEVVGRLRASSGGYAAWSIGQALQMAAVAAVAVVVLLVVRDARRGEPFTGRNVRRFLLAAGACAVGLVGSFVASIGELESKFDTDLTPSTTISLVWVPVALVFYSLASVFRRGDALRAEAELTV